MTREALYELGPILELRKEILRETRRYFDDRGLIDIPVPLLVGATGSCENVSSAFRVGPRIFLSQTGQLSLELALATWPGVSCVTQSFRNDDEDQRHLPEFTLIEEEWTWQHDVGTENRQKFESDALFESLLLEISSSVKLMISVGIGCQATEVWGRDRSILRQIVEQPFARITYDDAIASISAKSMMAVSWGSDLGAAHEAELLSMVEEERGFPAPIFVTHYPADIKFFNMRADDSDERKVQSVDLLLPYSGEAVGGAVREERGSVLRRRFSKSGMFAQLERIGIDPVEEFAGYLDHVTALDGIAPHAGFGIGFERVLQFLIRSDDIRSTAPHRTFGRLLRGGMNC